VFVLEEQAAAPLSPAPVRLRSGDSGFELRPPSAKLRRELKKAEQHNAILQTPKKQPAKKAPAGIWNVGDVILGLYEVRALSETLPYAEGGVGIVHRVYHREWDKELAVKSPKPHVFQTETGKLNYEREAKTWIELGLHPNIVPCYLVRRIGETPRLFAEFVPDGSLKDWIASRKLYEGGAEASLLRILDIAAQFAWGLEHAHKHKLLHLDVKPANVMMSGQTAKVTDFGLSQSIVDEQKSGKWKKNKEKEQDDEDSKSILDMLTTGGMTPGYCSPEQYSAFTLAKQRLYSSMPKITLQSDIWSWAVSVLAMFHGRSPCKRGGQTARQVFESFLKTPPPADGQPAMPKPLAELLLHCFEEKPEKRPEHIGWVADEIIKIYKDVSGVAFPRLRPVSATWTPESINNRAASMLDLNKPDEAEKLLGQAAAIQPWHPEVTYNQTLLAWRAAKITDLTAVGHLETLVKTRQQSAAAHYAMGLLQRERGNPQSAMDSLEDALRIEPRDDIRRTLLAAEKVAEQSARCLERFNILQGREDEVFADDRGEFILIPAAHQTLELRDTETGHIKNLFSLSKEPADALPGSRLALSSDLMWEIVCGTEPDTVFLKRVGAGQPAAVLRLLHWKRYFGKREPAERNLVVQPGVPLVGETQGTEIILYDKESRQLCCRLYGHEDTVTALCFSADGRFALSGGLDRVMILWELPSGRCLRTFRSLGGAADAVYFGRNNKFVLSLIAGGLLRLWDISILCGQSQLFRSPLLLSNVASAEEVSRQQSEMNQYCNIIRDAVQNADYNAALQAVENAKDIDGWETARRTLDNEGLWDNIARHTVRDSLENVLNTYTFAGHQDTVSTAALSLDGNLAASAGRDQTIRIWDITQQKCVRVLEGHYDWIRSVEMTMDAKFLVSGSWDMSVRVWNIASGQCVRKFEEKVKSLTKIALNPQGRIVAVANGTGSVFLWDVLTDEIKGRFLAHNGSVNTIRFNRNGQYFLTGGDDNLVNVWQFGTEEPVRTIKFHKAPVTAAVFSTDGSRIISADREGQIAVWNSDNGQIEFTLGGHLSDVTALELLADNRFFLSCSKDKKVRLGGVLAENQSMQRVIEGHPSPLLTLAVDVTGRRFITGGEDALVRIWDMYWNYRFPGWSGMTPSAERTLNVLLSLYSDNGKLPELDGVIIQRILLEMEYRGFGMILPKEVKQRIRKQTGNVFVA
jgi:WD40 repeat protein/serine/threonine protein kinase